MTKLVVLKLKGTFRQGFDVSLEIGEDGQLPSVDLEGNLPLNSDISKSYEDWKDKNPFRGNRGIKPIPGVTNLSFEDFRQTAEVLSANLNDWLDAKSFQSIKDGFRDNLHPSDEIRFIIRTEDELLRKLPWHSWNLFQTYNKAEVSLSANQSYDPGQGTRKKLRILVILGNDQGIDIKKDKKIIETLCENAELVFLNQPALQKLNEHLGEKSGWDILFFSGHSETERTKGRIHYNYNDSLTMENLSYALQMAIKQGLQIAIFNSCDGLGIAADLEDCFIPQVIVMREPVPDKVAQEFLKYFLTEYTNGESFYQSVGIARKKLQGLEDKYPCASWLPVIVQNKAVTPPTWQDLGGLSAEEVARKNCRKYQDILAEKASEGLPFKERTLEELRF